MSNQKRRDLRSLVVGVLLVVVGAYVIISGIQNATDNVRPLIAPSGAINVEIVDTPQSRQLGLSGRESLDENQGMVFVFDNIDTRNCFWMKDMQFAIDMIWLDEEKRVVSIADNVAPETFPQSFCPQEPAKYGLEVGAGRSVELGIYTGEVLRF